MEELLMDHELIQWHWKYPNVYQMTHETIFFTWCLSQSQVMLKFSHRDCQEKNFS
jgi:hypothetical protein